LSFTETWGNKVGYGKFLKRQRNRAERRYAKQVLKHGRGKEPVGQNSECNWKGW